MLDRSRLHPTRAVATLLALTMSLSLALVAGSASTSNAGTARGATAASTIAVADRTVARNSAGALRSRISGTTANGRQVTGDFVPLRFVKRDGTVRVRGLINGVIRNADGSSRTFSVLRTMRVQSINGTPARAGRLSAAATCDILRLRLAPLRLDLLGLIVRLDRVVLDIVARTGAGNLLGNLLCAVAGLLDGGLGGLLNRLVRLLNRILGQLGLGL